MSFTSAGKPEFHYYIKDHLGSIRVVCDRNGNAEQVNHYYPYGGLIGDLSTDDNKQKYRYKYNGKEFDRMHGLDWYDYGARWMDASIGRWHSVDPLAEDKPWQSPYLFCSGNPIIRIDPDGMEDYTVNEFGQMYESTSYLEAFFETIFSLFGGGCNQDRIYKEGSDKLLASYPEGTINLVENNSEITQIEIKENKYAASFTNMVMKETNVEWARISHGKNNDSSNTILNNHNDRDVNSSIKFLDRYKKQGESILIFDHSHPIPKESRGTNDEFLMKLKVSPEDKQTVKKYAPKVSRVYNKQTNQIEYYNYKGVYHYEKWK